MLSRARRLTNPIVEEYDWTGGAQAHHGRALAPVVPATALATTASVAASVVAAVVETADDHTRLAAMERDAFAKGYAQGERAGAEVAATRGEAMLRRLTETLEELKVLRAEMIRRTERQTVQLALAIARRVLERELSLDRGLLVAMARVALDRLGEQATATIRLHPDDYAAVVGSASTDTGNEQVRVVADSVVSRGGCLVNSDFGFMDVGLDAQFSELVRTLLGENDLEPTHEKDTQPHGVVVRS